MPQDVKPDDKPDFDGRRLRSKKSEDKIADAALRLNEQGNMAPTAHDLAQESGLSLRTVFRLFNDMESIFRDMNRRLYKRYTPELTKPIEGTTTEERLYGCILNRIDLFESCTPYIRSTQTQKWKFPSLEENYRGLQKDLTSDIYRWLPELTDLPQSTQLGVDALLSFESWDRMRTHSGKSKKQCGEAIYASALILLQNS